MKFKVLLRSLAIVFAVITVGLPAQAGMVATDQIQNSGVTAGVVDVSAQRDWIEARLLQGGIAQPEAIVRVSALTDVEVAQIYQRIDDVPAGAGGSQPARGPRSPPGLQRRPSCRSVVSFPSRPVTWFVRCITRLGVRTG